MAKEKIMAVYLLFLRCGPSILLNCIHGICLAEAIEDNPQSWLEYANALQKQEESVYRMLRVIASSNKHEVDVTKAYTMVEKGGRKIAFKNELGSIGISKGAVQTG